MASGDPTRKYLIKSSGASKIPAEHVQVGDLVVSHVPVSMCPALVTSVNQSAKGVINKGRLIDINVITSIGSSYTAVVLFDEDHVWVIRKDVDVAG